MSDSVAVPVFDYRVYTTSGRMFIWAATDSQHLIDQVYRAGHIIKESMLNSLYEAEEALQDEYSQIELVDEITIKDVA